MEIYITFWLPFKVSFVNRFQLSWQLHHIPIASLMDFGIRCYLSGDNGSRVFSLKLGRSLHIIINSIRYQTDCHCKYLNMRNDSNKMQGLITDSGKYIFYLIIHLVRATYSFNYYRVHKVLYNFYVFLNLSGIYFHKFIIEIYQKSYRLERVAEKMIKLSNTSNPAIIFKCNIYLKIIDLYAIIND